VLGSIPTAPTNHPFSQQQLSDLSRRQKAAISFKGGTHGSNERIPAVLRQCRSLDSASTDCFIFENAVLFRDREGHMYDYLSRLGCHRHIF
jgi:hypothetical protein